VEVWSKEEEGADVFVDTVGTDFISTNITAADDEELTLAYQLIIAVAVNASPEKIASGIPESEIRTFIEHTRDTLATLSTDGD
jgi:triphosphoribosyl-dephospho-CoA synthetase